jgi:arylsulfatase A-like enzyme
MQESGAFVRSALRGAAAGALTAACFGSLDYARLVGSGFDPAAEVGLRLALAYAASGAALGGAVGSLARRRPARSASAWVAALSAVSLAVALFETRPSAPLPAVAARGEGGAARPFEARPAALFRGDRLAPRPGPGAPNVLLVTVDTLRADRTSAYGYARRTSPHLEALARSGVLFERAYAQSSSTAPSTASLFTSAFQGQHGIGIAAREIPEELETLAEALERQGYATAAFVGNPQLQPEYGFGRGFQRYELFDQMGRADSAALVRSAVNLERLLGFSLGDATLMRFVNGTLGASRSDAAISSAFGRWLDARPADRPFFAYLHYMAPHIPYDPPPELRAEFGAPARGVVDKLPWTSGCYVEHPDVDDSRRREFAAFYDALVRSADREIGAVLDALGRAGLVDSSVVVVTADHGEEFYDHRGWGHGHTLYEELIHVPLLMRMPGLTPAGRRVPFPVMSVDVMTTILAAVGAPVPRSAMGRNLLASLDASGVGPAYAQMAYGPCRARAVVTAEHKYAEWDRGGEPTWALFALAGDPGERQPIRDASPLRDELRRLADLQDERTTALYEDGQAAPMDAAVRERLRALGYVE